MDELTVASISITRKMLRGGQKSEAIRIKEAASRRARKQNPHTFSSLVTEKKEYIGGKAQSFGVGSAQMREGLTGNKSSQPMIFKCRPSKQDGSYEA